MEAGSRGAMLLAGAGAVAWLVWPETAKLARRAERLEKRAAQAVTRAERAKERNASPQGLAGEHDD